MAQINQEALKKHHFWIVAGLVPVLTLVAILVIWTGGGNAIAAGAKLISDALNKGGNTKPGGKWVLGKLDDQKAVVAAKKDKLWEFNWNDQKELFTWPVDNGGRLTNFLRDPKDPNYAKDPSSAMIMKFGSPLSNEQFEFTAFKDASVYRKAFETEAKSMEPTQFLNGSWTSVMRFVQNWTEKQPESWMIWLALEDLWVQRGMLDPIRSVTRDMAKFTPVVEKGPDGKPLPAGLKRSFVSRIWQIDLEVKSEGPHRYLAAKIRNLTDRVQLLGLGNVMTLNVYFDNQVNPFEFRIEGEYIESGLKEATPVRTTPFHELPPTLSPTAIVRVEQVFDARTVPVKRIDRMLIGKTGNRHVAATLKKAPFVPEDPAAAAAAAPGAEGGATMPNEKMGRMGAGMNAGTASGLEGVFQDYRLRYLEVTDQVRRTPVAIVMVVDSMYIQDVLSAYSNSKLRFQITQFHYKRFHDKLTMPSSSSSDSGGFGGGSGSSGGTMFGGDFGSPEMGGSLMGRGRGGKGSGMGMGMGMGIPPAMGASPGAGSMPGIPGGGMPGIPGGAGVATGGGSPGAGSGYGSMYGSMGFMGSSGVADSQTSAGLVELTIYGIVSLYDRFGTTPGADATSTGTTTTPATTTPATTTPATTVPVTPAPSTTPAPGTAVNPAANPGTTTPDNSNKSTPPAQTSPAPSASPPMTPAQGNPPAPTNPPVAPMTPGKGADPKPGGS